MTPVPDEPPLQPEGQEPQGGDDDADLTPHPRGLTRDQERAITALMTEPTVAKAALAARVGERSIYRWLREDAAFGEAYRNARRDAFGAAAGVAQRLAPNALVVLAKIMNDVGASHAARVSAATAVLKFGRDALELDDLAARVEALERASKETKAWP